MYIRCIGIAIWRSILKTLSDFVYVDLKTTLGVAYLLDFSRLLLNTQGHQVNIARKRRSYRIRVEAVEVITTKPRKHSNCERLRR